MVIGKGYIKLGSINNFTVYIKEPNTTLCSCSSGYYMNEEGYHLGSQVHFKYKQFYDPKTWQLLPMNQWDPIYPDYSIYWITTDGKKILAYEPKK